MIFHDFGKLLRMQSSESRELFEDFYGTRYALLGLTTL